MWFPTQFDIHPPCFRSTSVSYISSYTPPSFHRLHNPPWVNELDHVCALVARFSPPRYLLPSFCHNTFSLRTPSLYSCSILTFEIGIVWSSVYLCSDSISTHPEGCLRSVLVSQRIWTPPSRVYVLDPHTLSKIALFFFSSLMSLARKYCSIRSTYWLYSSPSSYSPIIPKVAIIVWVRITRRQM